MFLSSASTVSTAGLQPTSSATLLVPPPPHHLSPSPPPQPPPGAAMARTQLKFGMDRILSGDIAPRRRHLSSTSPGSGEHVHGDHVHSGVPCSECVSSLLRCCQVSTASSPSPPGPLPLPSLAAPTPTYAAFYPSALHHLPPPSHYAAMFSSSKPSVPSSGSGTGGGSGGGTTTSSSSGGGSGAVTTGGKRKRSWSRAVFSNLQRKGLEKRFQLQKYITKPDRRQLAATLGLTDAQVKVWFQNRRMKWRHSKEAKQAASSSGAAGVAVQPADSRGSALGGMEVVAEERSRAADSTQQGGATSEDSDIDVEADS